jgi:hypothetical protein
MLETEAYDRSAFIEQATGGQKIVTTSVDFCKLKVHLH